MDCRRQRPLALVFTAARSLHRRRRRFAAATASLITAAALTACGGALPPPNMHNIAQIQLAIEQTLATKKHLNGTAYCPETVPVMKGEVFSCVVAVNGHAPLLFTVTEANNVGAVTYVGR